MSTVKPVPDGFHTATPYLVVNSGPAAIDFYKQALGATEVHRHADPVTGRILHALLRIGDSFIMMGEHDKLDTRGESTMPRASIYLYVENVDALFEQAVAAGARIIMPVADQFYGDRSGGFEDPYGIVWWVSTHIEDMPDEELIRRAAGRSKA